MKVIKYLATWFETDGTGNSRAKFEAGKFYPITDESENHVAQGVAEVVDAPEDADKAEAAADKAQAKAEEAAAAAEAARAKAEAATAAADIAAAAAPEAAAEQPAA